MIVTKNTKYEQGAIANTTLQYSKAQIQGSVDTVSAGQSLRLQFKASDVQLMDLANSMLCFTLNITQKSAKTGNCLVPNESVADLFEVQSVSLNGIRLNLQQLNYAGMLFRRVKSKINGNQAQLTTGQEKVDMTKALGLSGYYASAVDAAGPTIVPYPDTFGLYPNADLSNAACFWDSNIVNDALNDYALAKIITDQEQKRLVTQAARHYNRRPTDPKNPLYTKHEQTLYKNYSIKLGELVPELAGMTIVDKSIFAGSGLEIQLNLLDPSLSMQKIPMNPALYGVNGVNNVNLNATRDPEDTYSISNIYMANVFHKTLSPSLGLFNRAAFTSVYHTRQAITLNQVNHQFSLNSGCYVRGLVILYSPSNMSTLGTNVNIPAFKDSLVAGATQKSYNNLSKAYFQNQQVLETVLQIGNQLYPMTQAPPVGSKSQWYHQISQFASEQVFSAAYGCSLERYLTIDFAQFIPVQRVVKQAELFQFYQSYESCADFANIELNILCICERVLDIQNDGTVLIENM